MTQTEFISALNRVTRSYKWSYVNNTLVGVAKNGELRGCTFNPITAVARTLRVGTYSNDANGTTRAGRALGLSQELVDAILSSSNRGHAQIVRGKMLNVLSN